MAGASFMGDGALDGPRAPLKRSAVVDAEDSFGLPSVAELEKIVYDREAGSQFAWDDRYLLTGQDDAGLVFSYSDWEARDLHEMLKRDYRARQLEAVLTFPSISANRTMSPAKGDRGEYEWLDNFWSLDGVNGGCETPLDMIVDQMTSSVIYKKAYWELVWTRGRGDFAGKSVYKRVSWRPQTSTRALHDPRNGNILGWQQEPYVVKANIARGYYPIERLGTSQFVHVHGNRRDPVNGVSDLEVCYWAYKAKQKILYLLLQFLTGVARPDTIVKAQDPGTAQAIAVQINNSKGGVIPVGVDGKPDGVSIDVLDRGGNGKGAEQFMQFISWLDSCAVNAVMAGFLDLPSAAANGRGSNALNVSASDFFLQSLENKHREYEYSLRSGLFAPLVRFNLGRDAKVPLYKFEALTSEDKAKAFEMLNAIIAAYAAQPQLIPDELVMMLAQKVGDYLGADGAKLRDAFSGVSDRAAQIAEKANAAAASAPGQQVARAAGAVNAATRAMKAGKAGRDPVAAAKGKAA